MLAFELGDLNVWLDDTLPAGIRHVYGEDEEGGRVLVISPDVSADDAIRLVKQFARSSAVHGDTATVRLLQTA